MNGSKITVEEIDKIFGSDNLDKQLEFLDSLQCDQYDPIIANHLCSYLAKPVKGLRNALSHFFLKHKCYHIAENLTEFITSNDIALRNIAGEILIAYKSYAVDSLINFLKKNKNEIHQKYVADILARINDKKVEKHVLELIKNTENENVLISFIEALGNNRSIQSVDLLITLYSKSEIFKPYIIQALGAIGTVKCFHFINEKYSEEDDLVKFVIIESLGDIGNEESFFFLLAELQSAKEPFIPPILESLYKLHMRYGFDIPYDDKIKRSLITILNHKEQDYKRLGAKLITEYEDEEIIFEALKHYGNDTEYDEIIYHKLKMNKELVFKQIIQLLDSEAKNLVSLLKLLDEFLIFEPDVIKELNQIYVHKLVDSISRCLKHPDELVRLTSVELLFKIEPETAILFLDEEFLNENFWIKIRLTELLESITDEACIKFLEKLSEDENEMVRQRANEILIAKKQLN